MAETETGAMGAQSDDDFLDRGAILNADDAKYGTVEVPEWQKPGGPIPKVRVRGLTSTERDAWESSMTKEVPDPHRKGKTKMVTDASNLRAKLVVRCVVDKHGQRIFQDGDIANLGAKNAAAVNRIFEKAQELSGIREEDVAELEGNSDGALSVSSSAS